MRNWEERVQRFPVKILSSSRSSISCPTTGCCNTGVSGRCGRCWLQTLTGTVLGLQPSSFVWLLATRFVTAGEPLLGPLPHLSPFPLQSVTDQNKSRSAIYFPPMLSYGHKLHTRAHLRMRFFLHCRETESFISGHLNSRVNTKHMYNRTKAQSESNLTTKYQCTCCSSLHTCPNL